MEIVLESSGWRTDIELTKLLPLVNGPLNRGTAFSHGFVEFLLMEEGVYFSVFAYQLIRVSLA